MQKSRGWNPGWIAAAVLVAIVVFAGGRPLLHQVARAFGLSHTHQLGTGDRLAGLELTSLQGTALTLPTAGGRPRIINVFATWCTECRAEMADLKAAVPAILSSGVSFVGIDQQESGPQVQTFAHEYGLHYPLYVDSSGITHSLLGARYIPTTLAIDAHGIIRAVHAGPLTTEEFKQLARLARNAG